MVNFACKDLLVTQNFLDVMVSVQFHIGEMFSWVWAWIVFLHRDYYISCGAAKPNNIWAQLIGSKVIESALSLYRPVTIAHCIHSSGYGPVGTVCQYRTAIKAEPSKIEITIQEVTKYLGIDLEPTYFSIEMLAYFHTRYIV